MTVAGRNPPSRWSWRRTFGAARRVSSGIMIGGNDTPRCASSEHAARGNLSFSRERAVGYPRNSHGRAGVMRRVLASGVVIGLLIVGATTALAGSAKHRLDNDLVSFTKSTGAGTNGPGGGGISGVACVSSVATQPPSFTGNALLDCDSVGPHNETTIAVNPTNAANIVAASHTYLYNLDKQSAIALLRIFTEAYVSKDGGQTWTNVHPPHGSYRFLTDPALAFDADGRLYWSNVASHDSVGGAFSDVSVIVERSDDGGITWTDPVTVAKGNGTISNGGSNAQFNDKDWLAVDRGTSRYRGSVYVTWARQQYRKDVQTESPIFFVR